MRLRKEYRSCRTRVPVPPLPEHPFEAVVLATSPAQFVAKSRPKTDATPDVTPVRSNGAGEDGDSARGSVSSGVAAGAWGLPADKDTRVGGPSVGSADGLCSPVGANTGDRRGFTASTAGRAGGAVSRSQRSTRTSSRGYKKHSLGGKVNT